MSTLKNSLAAIVPIRERRESAATLGSVNAELQHPVNGDESVLVYVNASVGTFNATIDFSGSVDGVNFFSIPAFPFSPGCTGATAIPLAAQPLFLEAINTTSVVRVYSIAVGQLKIVRVRLPVWTAGNADVTTISDSQTSASHYTSNLVSNTLMGTATAAVGVAVTATLPLVTGLRHYLSFIKVTRSATAALTASATPVLVTTTNLPGNPAMTFGSDAGGIGIDKEVELQFGNGGLAATALGTNTTVVAPAYTGVIWRINFAYRLGL